MIGKFDKEGDRDAHFMPCINGCSHLTQVDLSDSREGFHLHRLHLFTCSATGRPEGEDPEARLDRVHLIALTCTPITEYEARKRSEKKCPKCKGWNPEWHRPHEWSKPDSSRQLQCYGFGDGYRQVPELPAEYYTARDEEEHE